MKPFLRTAIVALLGIALAGSVQADESLRVVTTLSTFADLVETIGGDHVKVSYVASPKFNPHFIEPKPSDVLKVKKADLFVHAGLDLELWRWSLVDAAGNTGVRPGGSRELDLSQGVRLLEVPTRQPTRAEGDIHIYGNPHYWLHPDNVKVMVQTIATKLSELDPTHATGYQKQLADFLKQLDEQVAQWQQKIPLIQDREIVAYHNEWPYLAQFTGVKIDQFLEPKPGIPPTPKQLVFLGRYIRERKIRAIVQSSYFPRTASNALAERSGATVVMLCQNVGELPEASDYLALMDYNVNQLVQALSSETP